MAERLAPLDYYKWHWKRFRLSRNVQRLHYVARGLYRELLDEQFAEGFIPDSVALLADICGCPLIVMQEHWPSLERFFPISEPGQRINPNQEENRTELDRKRAAQSRAGAISAALRAANKSTFVEAQTAFAAFDSTDVETTATDVQPEEKRREEIERREKKNKAQAPFVVPPWIDPDVWSAFEDMRKKLRKPMTDHARSLIVKKLVEFEAKGNKSETVLNNSIVNSWQDVYEPKNGGNRGKQDNRTFSEIARAAEDQTGRDSEGSGHTGGWMAEHQARR